MVAATGSTTREMTRHQHLSRAVVQKKYDAARGLSDYSNVYSISKNFVNCSVWLP
jgi:hypothetical protein